MPSIIIKAQPRHQDSIKSQDQTSPPQLYSNNANNKIEVVAPIPLKSFNLHQHQIQHQLDTPDTPETEPDINFPQSMPHRLQKTASDVGISRDRRMPPLPTHKANNVELKKSSSPVKRRPASNIEVRIFKIKLFLAIYLYY